MTIAQCAVMAEVARLPSVGFDWRVQTGTWRWLILGALGGASLGCGGRTSAVDPDSSGSNVEGTSGSGGTGGATSSPQATGDGGVSGTGTGPDVSSSGSGGGSGSYCLPPFEDLGGGWQRCAN